MVSKKMKSKIIDNEIKIVKMAIETYRKNIEHFTKMLDYSDNFKYKIDKEYNKIKLSEMLIDNLKNKKLFL